MPRFNQGEVSEWLKEHAWKVCIPPKGIAGSNPALSAKKAEPRFLRIGVLILCGSEERLNRNVSDNPDTLIYTLATRIDGEAVVIIGCVYFGICYFE